MLQCFLMIVIVKRQQSSFSRIQVDLTELIKLVIQ